MTDAVAVVESVNRTTGRRFSLAGRASGGEVGAWFVEDELGRRHVLKWDDERPGLDEARRAARRRAEVLRRWGAAVPGVLVHGVADGVRYEIQEGMPGAPIERLTHRHVDQLIATNGLFAGHALGGGEPWPVFIARTLLKGEDGWCLHEPLRAYSAQTRRVLDLVHEVGDRAERVLPAGADFVHLDFHQLNVLAEDDRVTAVIDCGGLRDGDRNFDLVTLAYGARHLPCEAGVVDRLDSHVEAIADTEVVRVYRAHMTLRLIDWSIRHHDAATVERHVEAARWILT